VTEGFRRSHKLGSVQTVTVEDVLQELARALLDERVASCGGAIAFDGDGTLWRGDVGDDFFLAMVGRDGLLPPAVDAMRAVAHGAGLVDVEEEGPGCGAALARRLYAAYLESRFPEDLICEVAAWACAGWKDEDVTRLAREVIERGDFASRRYAEPGVIIEWARASAVEVYLVSASPRPVVEAAAAAWGFDSAHVLATTARFAGGVMLPEVVRPVPYGGGKVALLRDRLGQRELLAAFGDNTFDVPMLEAARMAVLVEPKPRFLSHLASLEGEGAAFARRCVRLRVASGGRSEVRAESSS
jgi:phosphoserine phosphatase